MHPIWTLAAVDSGIITFIIVLIVIVVNFIKVAIRRSKQQQEERRRLAEPPKSAPETGTAPSAPPKETAATEVDRFLEELARQSGAPVPPRRPAPPRPRPPVAAPQSPAPASEARLHAPAAAGHAPAAQPQSAAEAMAAAMALAVEAEPVARLPAMSHLSPFARAIVLREILGPCRWFRPYRVRGW